MIFWFRNSRYSTETFLYNRNSKIGAETIFQFRNSIRFIEIFSCFRNSEIEPLTIIPLSKF